MTDRPPVRINFECPRAGADELLVTSITGFEGLSQLYRFELDLSSEIGAIELGDVVGSLAKLTFVDEEGDRYIHGVVVRFEAVSPGC